MKLRQMIFIMSVFLVTGAVAFAETVNTTTITPTNDLPAVVTQNVPVLPVQDAGNETRYDGIWFLGFNLARPAFMGGDADAVNLRRFISIAIDRETIARSIMGAVRIPDSIIPPGMSGYRPANAPLRYDPDAARIGLKQGVIDKVKTLTLLYTDGTRTEKAVKKIRDDLAAVGISVNSVTVNYADRFEFERKLREGKYDLFLMGYKTEKGDTAELFRELFLTGSQANFFQYSNDGVDKGIEKVVMGRDDDTVYGQMQETIWDAHVMVPIFYIEKIE